MGVPVYLFTGFLESGKTTLIKETLMDPGFQDGEKTLIISCEEGLEAYDETFLEAVNARVLYIDDMEDLSYENLKRADSLIEPDRVMIEFNGMWKLTDYLETCDFPYDWMLVQILSTVDASTFEMYIANMRSLIYEQLLHSEVIIFNRCDETTRKLYLRNNIKAMNKSAQLIYETKAGEIVELGEEDLPFDLRAPLISISDDDYGLWYMDAMEHPDKYDGKKIELKAKVIATHVEDIPNAFVFGRMAMVCCADDTSLIGLLVHSKSASQLIPKEWVKVQALVRSEYDPGMQANVPILYAQHIESAEPMQDEFVYFT